MLVLFRVKNYGPFKDEAVFDLRAIKSYKEHPYNLIQEENDNALIKVAAIYGANASGKTNFIEAYENFLKIVISSFAGKTSDDSLSVLEMAYYPFLFDEDMVAGNTEFEAVYHADGMEYRYGFTYNDEAIQEEWLYRTSLSTKRQTTILERDTEGIVLGAAVRKDCEKYIHDIDKDVLALSFYSRLKLEQNVFDHVRKCITDFLPVFCASSKNVEAYLKRYFREDFCEEEKPQLLRFLSAIDVGIKDVRVVKGKENKIEVFTTHVGRGGTQTDIPISLESDGTRKAIAIYSLVRIATAKGKGLIIDELNSQLHPLLQKYLIDLFYEGSSTGQLIYTTHDTNLLDKKYMRRDQVWFVNKNDMGESTLCSLAEFKIRNDKSFEKDYLSGVYGGIPILKDFSFKEE